MTRKYSSISVATTLNGTISASATTIAVASGTASLLLGGVSLAVGNVDQFTIAVDVDTTSEEIMFVTGVSGDVLTVVRARAGTTAIGHTTGATIKHVLTSDDLDFYYTQAPAGIVTAKGDLVAATALGAVTRVAVGTNDQALVADSTAATGVSYKNVVLGSSYTAKGALVVGTGSGTYTTQTIGTNGQLLIADSTQADGLKWGDLDTGNALYPVIMAAY